MASAIGNICHAGHLYSNSLFNTTQIFKLSNMRFHMVSSHIPSFANLPHCLVFDSIEIAGLK